MIYRLYALTRASTSFRSTSTHERAAASSLLYGAAARDPVVRAAHDRATPPHHLIKKPRSCLDLLDRMRAAAANFEERAAAGRRAHLDDRTIADGVA